MSLDWRTRGYQKFFWALVAGALALAGARLLQARQELNRYGKILIIRGLDHEVAVAKVPLPWGKHGVRVKADGQEDHAAAVKQLSAKGESVKPGIPVEITDIRFKPGRIVFAINGGGKTGEHWYQHLQIGMGGLPAPMMSQRDAKSTPSNGSYVTVELPANDPNPSLDKVKRLLSSVLDFSRRAPTVLYSPAMPPQFKDAIKRHEVVLGMGKTAVLSAKGSPDRRVRKDLPDGTEEEDWLYGDPPHVLFVIFLNDTVAKTQQY
ncbi:MAG: hypothetical protein ACRD3D_06085 [Terriglobia bacterium]